MIKVLQQIVNKPQKKNLVPILISHYAVVQKFKDVLEAPIDFDSYPSMNIALLQKKLSDTLKDKLL